MNKNIIIDIDGVLADLHKVWLPPYNKTYKDNMTKDQITEWGMHKLVKPECGVKIYDYLRDPDLYENCPEIEGALDGVKEIRAMGFAPLFVSSGFHLGKMRWMYNHGFTHGDWFNDMELVQAADKYVFINHADYIIDDYHKNLEGYRFPICFDQPWNKEYRGHRAYNWEGVVTMLQEKLSERVYFSGE